MTPTPFRIPPRRENSGLDFLFFSITLSLPYAVGMEIADVFGLQVELEFLIGIPPLPSPDWESQSLHTEGALSLTRTWGGGSDRLWSPPSPFLVMAAAAVSLCVRETD